MREKREQLISEKQREKSRELAVRESTEVMDNSGLFVRVRELRGYLSVVVGLPLPSLLFPDNTADGSGLEEEKHGVNLRPSQRHRLRCREIAASLWEGDATITIAGMAYRDEINRACEGEVYADSTIRKWIKDLCPNRLPGRRKKSTEQRGYGRLDSP